MSLPIENFIMILLCSNVIVALVVYIVLDPRKTDYGSEGTLECTRSHHFFPKHTKHETVYCYCGNESMHVNELKEYLEVKT